MLLQDKINLSCFSQVFCCCARTSNYYTIFSLFICCRYVSRTSSRNASDRTIFKILIREACQRSERYGWNGSYRVQGEKLTQVFFFFKPMVVNILIKTVVWVKSSWISFLPLTVLDGILSKRQLYHIFSDVTAPGLLPANPSPISLQGLPPAWSN